MNVIVGLLIPFIGTTLGAMMVLFMRKEINNHLQRVLTGFAAGVMVSASFWSLLIPGRDGKTPYASGRVCRRAKERIEKNNHAGTRCGNP